MANLPPVRLRMVSSRTLPVGRHRSPAAWTVVTIIAIRMQETGRMPETGNRVQSSFWRFSSAGPCKQPLPGLRIDWRLSPGYTA